MKKILKVEKRGRSKFVPKEVSEEIVRNSLLESITKEQEKIKSLKTELLPEVRYDETKWNVVSLFSGCGGLDLGLLFAGIQSNDSKEEISNSTSFAKKTKDCPFTIVYSIDNFKEALETHKRNHLGDDVVYDIRDIKKISKFPKCDMIIGGFPCPGYSLGGPRLIDDRRNFLYLHFIRALIQTKPKIFVAENVKGLLTLGKGVVFEQMKDDFADAGYVIYFKLLNSVDFGVPQERERVFIIGVRKDVDFVYKFPSPTHGVSKRPYVTLKDSIYDLKDDYGPLHIGSFSSMYLSRNRKRKWDEPSFTIQASGRQAPLHPNGSPMKNISKDKWILQGDEKEHRRLSIKEIARIQTFPDWFIFYNTENEKVLKNTEIEKIYKQIGNAVPVELARNVFQPIAEYVLRHLDNSKKRKREE